MHRRALLPAVLVVLGGCSFIVDTSGLSAPSEVVAEAGPPTDATAEGTSDGGGGGESGPDAIASDCPSGRGPSMLRIKDSHGAFCIDQTEVTNDQFNVFLAAKTSELPQPPAECSYRTSYTGPARPAGTLPVNQVDWCDAWMFCAWAGRHLCGSRTGAVINDFAPANDPAISEWFAACSRDGARAYPYGATHDEKKCNGCQRTLACGTGGAPLVPVGSLATCEGGYDGLFDMSGNVGEWEDNCDRGGTSRALDTCVLRGGARGSGSTALLCAANDTATVKRNETTDKSGIRCCAP